MVRICKSWEEQVLDNTNKIEELEESISDIDITEINQKLDRALVTPIQAPSNDKLVGIDTSNEQTLLTIGPSLSTIGNVLGVKQSGYKLYLLNIGVDINNVGIMEYTTVPVISAIGFDANVSQSVVRNALLEVGYKALSLTFSGGWVVYWNIVTGEAINPDESLATLDITPIIGFNLISKSVIV